VSRFISRHQEILAPRALRPASAGEPPTVLTSPLLFQRVGETGELRATAGLMTLLLFSLPAGSRSRTCLSAITVHGNRPNTGETSSVPGFTHVWRRLRPSGHRTRRSTPFGIPALRGHRVGANNVQGWVPPHLRQKPPAIREIKLHQVLVRLPPASFSTVSKERKVGLS